MQLLESTVITIGALLVSLIFFTLFIVAVGADPIGVFDALYRGAFATWFSWQATLVGAAPLMLTALCTALPARMGLIVIGGEGAVIVGGMVSAVCGLAFGDTSLYLAVPAMILSGMAAGGAWIAFVGALKQFRGVNETISSLLLNYIAIAVMNYLVFGPLRDPSTLNKPSSYAINDNYLIGNIGNTSIHWGLAFGVVACLILWIVMRKTTFGFAVDIAGGNIKAAQLSGLNVKKLLLMTFFIAGAAAGLAGTLEVMAVHGRANSSLNAGYGYEGILIAFLARHNPLAIIPIAILFGGIRAGNGVMQRSEDLPDATGLVLQGIIFIVILAADALYGRFKILSIREKLI